MQSVSPLYFITQLLWNRDIHAVVNKITEVYKAKSFKVAIPFTSRHLYVLQEAQSVKKVLNAVTHLGSVNEHFNVSHGHALTINGLNMDEPVWHTLHSALGRLFHSDRIDSIMEEHWDLLIPSGTFCINDSLRLFLSKVLGEYFFGDFLSAEVYQNLQSEITDYVKLSFHNSAVNRLPVVGKLFCLFNYYRYRGQINAIDQKISDILDIAFDEESGAFFHLHQELQDRKMVHDNAFLSFLVFDFVYMVALDFFVHAANSEEERKKVAHESVDRAFLFPFRFRVAKEQIGEINPEDYCILNLKAANLHFSYGPRRCVGQTLFNSFMAKLLLHLESYTMEQVDETEIVYSDNPDIPAILSRHHIKFMESFS